MTQGVEMLGNLYPYIESFVEAKTVTKSIWKQIHEVRIILESVPVLLE